MFSDEDSQLDDLLSRVNDEHMRLNPQKGGRLKHFASYNCHLGIIISLVSAGPVQVLFANWAPACRVLIDNAACRVYFLGDRGPRPGTGTGFLELKISGTFFLT